MNHPEDISPVELFDNYFGPTLFAPWAEILINHADLRPGERVLDLACGTGTVARRAARMVGKHGKVVGVDISEGMLSVARSRRIPEGGVVEWHLDEAESLDFDDGSFDLVLCQQGIQFFSDRRLAVKQIRRVLAKNGRLALNVWQSLDKHAVFKALAEAEANYLGVPIEEVSAPFSFPEAGELRTLLESADFKHIDIIEETVDAVFPSPDSFVALTLFATTAFLPEFDSSNKELFDALTRAVSKEMSPVLEQHRSGDQLIFPMHWNIAVAHV